jgi:hypothetical protein
MRCPRCGRPAPERAPGTWACPGCATFTLSYVAVLRVADGSTRESLPFADRGVADRVGAYSLLDAGVVPYEVVGRPGLVPPDPAHGGKLPPRSAP